MSLRKRHGKWHYRFQIDRREYSGSTGLAATERNRTQAEMMEAQHRLAIQQGLRWAPRLRARLFTEAAEEFLEWARFEHRERPATWRRLRTSFASLKVYFAQTPVAMIGPGEVEGYKLCRCREHRVRDVTLRHDLYALSKFFRWAVHMNYARENPVRAVKVPSDTEAVRVHVITQAEERLYFAHAKGDLRDLAVLMLHLGLRPGEVLALQKEDVDLERGILRVRKGKTSAASRTLRLTEEAKRILAVRMAVPSPWLFPSPRRPSVARSGLNGVHDRLCQRLGLSFVLYDFRHTFATRMAEAGVDLVSLAALLGHSSLRVVMRYVHPSEQHKAQAMQRYEELLHRSGARQVVH